MVSIDVLGAAATSATKINNHGGGGLLPRRHRALWLSRPWRNVLRLIFLYGFFGHGSIGNHGLRDIAGIYQDGSGTHGFIRKRGTFGSIDVPAASKPVVAGMNRQRQLVGLFQDDTGIHGFNRNAGWGDSSLSVADVMGSTSLSQPKPGTIGLICKMELSTLTPHSPYNLLSECYPCPGLKYHSQSVP